jgi:Arc/MetJ-type ribon-helix-helix transcriptional regulator
MHGAYRREGGATMAMKDKAMFSVELDQHMMAFLEDMVQRYELPDTSKALRILITYAMDPETERDRIFEDVRCFDCE